MSSGSPGVFSGGEWRPGLGTHFSCLNPCTSAVIWEGRSADATQVDEAIHQARQAFPSWSRRPLGEREIILRHFGMRIQQNRNLLAALISQCTGKPNWEALQEADLIPAKVEVSISAQGERLATRAWDFEGHQGRLRYRPHGVITVLGPFNLPAHLPHSHIVPALLAGNTVVFKPSEFAPGVGQFLAEQWHAAGLPAGVLNVVQGARETGVALAGHAGLDGLYFTGSYRGGLALSRLFAEQPGKILALEMGGNNPLVIWDPESLESAAILTLQSAFLTAGQRCVCARRLILPTGSQGDAFLEELLRWVESLRIGFPEDNPEPFYGPVIHAAAAEENLAAQARLLGLGGKIVLPMELSARCACLLTPGIIDVTEISNAPDEEIFGPLLQIIRVPDFDAAIAAANATRYGLSAGLISRQRPLWERFVTEVRAGVVNWNRQITGASGKLPFGGVGRSGNHRPSAFSAADYCAYPVASLENEIPVAAKLPPGLLKP